MDEYEAETVLLVLGGPHLKWQKNLALAKGGFYAVVFYRRKQFFWKQASEWYKAGKCSMPKGNCEVCPQKYLSIDEAKAACDRHHVTGKWE